MCVCRKTNDNCVIAMIIVKLGLRIVAFCFYRLSTDESTVQTDLTPLHVKWYNLLIHTSLDVSGVIETWMSLNVLF